MKQIYFIRHGQTEGNVLDTAHGKDMPLNPTGIEQADAVAARVANINVSKIYTSDFLRAQETASAIAKIIQVPIEYSDSFGEYLEPSSLFGLNFEMNGTQMLKILPGDKKTVIPLIYSSSGYK
jgi:broad specificity phosphatase PhoE